MNCALLGSVVDFFNEKIHFGDHPVYKGGLPIGEATTGIRTITLDTLNLN